MSTPTAPIAETTDESIALVMKSRSGGGVNCYHAVADGEPACGQTPRKSEYVEWPIERARAWRDPCSYCYPDGDDDRSTRGDQR